MVAAGLAVTVAAPFAIGAALGAAGFGAAGVTAGSVAAGIQSGIGNVATGSVFAGKPTENVLKELIFRLFFLFSRCSKCRRSWNCSFNSSCCWNGSWSDLSFDWSLNGGLGCLCVIHGHDCLIGDSTNSDYHCLNRMKEIKSSSLHIMYKCYNVVAFTINNLWKLKCLTLRKAENSRQQSCKN